MRTIFTIAFLLFSLPAVAAEISISPDEILLDSPESSQQLIVTRRDTGGRTIDVTRQVNYAISSPIARANDRGLVQPMADGQAKLVVRFENQEQTVPIRVAGFSNPQPVSFRNEIIPILTKAGCNSGGCHGKAEGQNGFKLSIFGYDARSDFQSLVMEGRGRRVFPASPRRSLVFLKGSARLPHGGGRKIEPGSYRDKRLLRWIAEGARLETESDENSRVVRIEVNPADQVLLDGESQQLQVFAIDAAGNRRCVTTETEFESNADVIAGVDRLGLVETSGIPGEAAILVRYLGRSGRQPNHVSPARRQVHSPTGKQLHRPAGLGQVDTIGNQPSGLAGDGEFMRRVFLDTIGTLPTADEVRQFLSDRSPNKRSQLIDRVLERDEYVDYWTMRWLDVLRADQLKISPQGAVAMQRWLRRHFSENRSFDELARDLLTVQGNTSAVGPGSFYKILSKPDEASRSISQLLLGVRIECAQCHHHPSERWSQADYTGLAGFFTGLKLKKLPNGEQSLVAFGGKDLPHPRTGEPVAARALGAEPPDLTAVSDRRRLLADWLTAPDNAFFARSIANRLWAHYFGRGLIEPVDDIRDTNPAVNEPLMRALTDRVREVDFDLKAFTRTLLNSRVYQLSSTTNPSNEDDAQNFSHGAYKTLPAEVLLDAISQCTDVSEKFNGWPDGYRAIQVWDNRMPSYFFRIFGRPVRASVCECERSNEPSISQALHLLNSPEIGAKIGHRRGRAWRLADSSRTPEEVVEELYLSTVSRGPTKEELLLMLDAFAADGDRRAACEDVLWALLNSKEFVFNH